MTIRVFIHLRTILLFVFMMMVAGCGQSTPVTVAVPTEPETPLDLTFDVTLLLEELRNADVTVETLGAVGQPIFAINGQMLRVSGENVQVFEFENTQSADQAATQVASDGFTINGASVDWIGTPHFYKYHHVIVLYVGDNFDITHVLESILGAQFAGGVTYPDI